MFRWFKRPHEAPWFVASPSAELARVAATVLQPGLPPAFGRDVTTAPPRSRIALVLCDPLLAEVIDAGPVAQPAKWLGGQCAALKIPVPTDGDFPFSEGREILAEQPRKIVLTRFESLHLLGTANPIDVLEREVLGFRERLQTTTLEQSRIDAAYDDPVIARLFRPFHRQMLGRKWRREARRLPDDELIVYHHIPKCAGMSVFKHLNAHLTWNDELVHLDARAERDVNATGAVPFAHKDGRELKRIEVLFGHDVSMKSLERLPNRRPLMMTCLRDPASRMVSHYNWEMHQRELAGEPIPDFASWYARQDRNWMTRWLGLKWLGLDVDALPEAVLFRKVVDTLRGFWLVCTTEDFDSAMRVLTDKLDLPPIATVSNRAGETYSKRFSLTDEWRRKISSQHPLDAELYAHFASAP